MPVLNNFIKVKGSFETATKASTRCPPVLLLHICLHSIIHLVHFNAVEELLSEYYTGNNQLKVLDLTFNISHDEAAADWRTAAEELIADLLDFEHVIVFVTTHSDPDSGDLWLGEERGKPLAGQTGEVSTGLF